jgi:hypothetical protein
MQFEKAIRSRHSPKVQSPKQIDARAYMHSAIGLRGQHDVNRNSARRHLDDR